ncbi:hypothetical protein KBB96_04550 [Luteolibacter ambystomatis]|uniref:Uncharacterized protein n=1 Tax=Luteolibacter ambystomatis TaxID=2824561 RepID=A0A975PFQ3_9BACT|nr:hypothetical protein [Luteolibacter ambystomatis]QUE52164.1 hypothetical protein KBB96_04550 [Luteolibacter ambystomatis]
MNTFRFAFGCLLLGSAGAMAQTGSSFTNFIRQVQLPSGVQWDASVAASGSQQSSLAIDPGGARFELWTVQSLSGATPLLLDSKYVGTYVPIAQVAIRSADPYVTIPRTRVDKPFYVDYSVSGLLSDPSAPAAAKSVNFLRHIQSYGAGGTGIGIDKTQATLFNTSSISSNVTATLTFPVTALVATPQTKVRGEERFSFFSLDDYQSPASQLAAQFIQIWPVADGSISGVTMNQKIRFAMPQVSLTMNDVYPSSTTYAQIYQGPAVLGTVGTVVPGSSLVVNETIPQSRVLTLTNWDRIFDADGQWTMELVTSTPFGVERLAYVTFNLDRTIQVNGNVTTID